MSTTQEILRAAGSCFQRAVKLEAMLRQICLIVEQTDNAAMVFDLASEWKSFENELETFALLAQGPVEMSIEAARGIYKNLVSQWVEDHFEYLHGYDDFMSEETERLAAEHDLVFYVNVEDFEEEGCPVCGKTDLPKGFMDFPEVTAESAAGKKILDLARENTQLRQENIDLLQELQDMRLHLKLKEVRHLAPATYEEGKSKP